MEGIQATEELLKGARFYIKRPMPIQAVKVDQTFWVASLEGNHQGREGDYLLRGIKGELYICRADIFEESYQLLNTLGRLP